MKKVMIPLMGDEIAPRFDHAPEVFIGSVNETGEFTEHRVMILAHASPEDLCDLIVREKVDTLICCGIEEEYYQFLIWKRVAVFDSVIGTLAGAMEAVRRGTIGRDMVLR
jgi:predicted Fe-Mo cluster-binding NifX family protein